MDFANLQPIMRHLEFVVAVCGVMGLVFSAMAQEPDATYPTHKPQSEASTETAVQVTELGCMRTLVVLDEKTLDLEKLINQRLSDVDFRVFPSPVPAKGRLNTVGLKAAAIEAMPIFYCMRWSRIAAKIPWASSSSTRAKLRCRFTVLPRANY